MLMASFLPIERSTHDALNKSFRGVGWYPELVFVSEVVSNCTDFAIVIPYSTVNGTLLFLL